MSYQGHNEDKDKVVSALGGKRGLIDSGLPALFFLVVFFASYACFLTFLPCFICLFKMDGSFSLHMYNTTGPGRWQTRAGVAKSSPGRNISPVSQTI